MTLGLDEDVTCTFVNDDDAPSLTLVKQVNQRQRRHRGSPSDWTLTAAGYDLPHRPMPAAMICRSRDRAATAWLR